MSEAKNEAIKKIANHYLAIETLETRHSDELDFHDLLIGNIKKALEEAYDAGQLAGTIKGEK